MTCPEPGCHRDGDHSLHADRETMWTVGDPSDPAPPEDDR